MNPEIKLILTVIVTLLLMFATSLLLDLPIVKSQTIRVVIVYIAIAIQFFFGYKLVLFQVSKK